MTAVAHRALNFATDAFAQRLSELRSGRNPDALAVKPNALPSLGGTQLPRSACGLFFESPVGLASEVINNDKPVLMGAHSYMNNGGYLRGPLAIGRYSSIGRRVSIGAGAHAMTGLSTSPYFAGCSGKAYDREQLIELGLAGKKRRGPWTILMHDVWVGDGAVIMPGVTIGTGAVIGANAVVTSDVDNYAIAAGAPAKIIGMRFPPGIAARLIGTGYWNLPPAVLKTLPAGNVLECLTIIDQGLNSTNTVADIPLYRLSPE